MELALRPTTERRWNGKPKHYAVVRDGVIVGKVEHTYRPKTCGGPAWEFVRIRLGMKAVTYFSDLNQAKKYIREECVNGLHVPYEF